MLEAGGTAPDFSLPGIVDGEPSYYDLHRPLRDGCAAVLLFAPVDFVPTITPDLVAAGEAEWRDRDDVVTWAITADSLFAHDAYATHHGIEIPLLTDRFAGIADAYDVVHDEFRAHRDVPRRAAFVVDPDWTVQFAWESDDPTQLPDDSPLDGVAAALSTILGEDVAAPAVQYE